MKSLFHLFAFDDTYGPGTDLAMALLGIFILSTAISKKGDIAKNNRMKSISENQVKVINALAQNYSTAASYTANLNDSVYRIATMNDDITVRNSEVSQLFTFGENILFEVGKAELKPEGVKVIGDLGKIIKAHAALIEEIQIQGHADTIPPSKKDTYKSNIELASARATTVFNFFNLNAGIDPSDILISIVSYGEFNPVQRRKNKITWNRENLHQANDTKDKRSQNRRIEILLIYK